MNGFTAAPIAEVRVDTNPESPWEGCISVEAGYWGTEDTSRIGWVVEFARTQANAQRIVRNQENIDRAVAKHGGRARVTVEFLPDGWMRVGEYDFNKWMEMYKSVK